MLSVFVVLLAPGAGVAAKKNWHLGDRTLREGMQGHDVKVLQNFLSRAGIRTTQDGAFGAGTTKAVRAFERFQQRSVDGGRDAPRRARPARRRRERRRGRQAAEHRWRAAEERRAAPEDAAGERLRRRSSARA